MPADTTLSMEPSAHHGNGNAPYPCHLDPAPPGGAGFIDYGYCRTSLDYHPDDYKQGSADPRCPKDCQHKASTATAQEFAVVFKKDGAIKAAAWAKELKERTEQ